MKDKRKVSIWTILKIIMMVLVVIITLYPFIYMISVSLSGSLYVMQNKIFLYPKGFTLFMYKYIFHNSRIFTAYKNTIIYVTLGTALSLLLTSMGAYALSKNKKLIFAKPLNIMVIITMYFSGGMIPLFLNVRSFRMLDTIWAMIIPGAISAWNLIIMRSFFMSFPSEIEDSGYVDGLNDFGVFLYLVLPTSQAVLATIGLYYAVNLWNSFYLPYLYIQTPSKYPLQVVLRDIVLAGTSVDGQTAAVKQDSVIVEDSLKFATIIISIIPIVAVYPFIQKYFVKGVMIGSIKG